MINALNKPSDEKNYADAAAQFAYRAYGFSGDQYNYIVSSIDKQFMEIIKMEMMYQEFIAQRGDYFEEKYPDDESKWESYAAWTNDLNKLNEDVAKAMDTMLDREILVSDSTVGSIRMKLDEFVKPEDMVSVRMKNENYHEKLTGEFYENEQPIIDAFNEGYLYLIEEYGWKSNADVITPFINFHRIAVPTPKTEENPSGIDIYYIFDTSQPHDAEEDWAWNSDDSVPENLRFYQFEEKIDLTLARDQHIPSCDFINLTKENYSDGQNQFSCAKNTAEFQSLCLYDDNSIESLKKITDACHEEGAKVSIQLQNAGPEGNAKNAGAPIQAATAIASADGRDIPEEVSTEKVYELVKGYGEAAERAMKGGADAVEIHMAHGYLVNSFMSPRTNKRVDEFGGNFENRMRFSRLIIEEVKKKTEGKIAVLARINSTEDMFGGLDNHDMCAVASYLEDCGIDGLHVSRAVHLKDEYMWAPTGIHGGFSAELVANIKKCVSIPVITVGRYTEPQFAEQIIKMGNADLVAFGRQSLADPHTPQKAMEERLEDLTPCIACLQGCVANMYAGKPICCLVNPVLGHEKEGLPKAEKAKKVYVIGGGVAGMCAAFTAKRRGHDVTLFEATDKLGGNMRLAAYPPGKGDITGMIRSYIVKCEKAGVNIKMNTKVTAQMLKEDTPDAVILATGAETLVLPFIKGIENPDIVYGVDCLEGTRPVGHKVLVVGGGMVGAETADFLAEQGHEVAIIEMRDAIGPDVIHEHRIFLMEAFEKYGIKQITSAAVSEIFSDGVSYKNAADKSDETIYEARGFDTVVLSMGFSSRYTHRDGQNVVYDFAEELKDIVPEVHMVGDAVRARRALDATKEAYEVALNL